MFSTDMQAEFGFKEWAAVCCAIGEGQQIVIIRKGGIVEDGGRFLPIHPEFVFLPTYLHQSDDQLKPEARAYIEASESNRPEHDVFRVQFHATVTDVRRVESLEKLTRIREEHVWSDATVEERFRRWRTESVYALIVRVLKAKDPIDIPILPEYQGCRSWVTFQQSIAFHSHEPVIKESEYEQRRSKLLDLLDQD